MTTYMLRIRLLGKPLNSRVAVWKALHLYCHLYGVVRVTKITGSTSDDWIY
jgi:hypothetical protein